MTLLEHRAQPAASPPPSTGGDARPQLSQIVRTWLGFAAIGAGMIHFALAVSAPVPLAIVLALLGLAEFAWGVLTFARDQLILPRLARSVAVGPIIVWSLLVVAGTLLDVPAIASSLSLFPMATATAFELVVGAVLSRHLRRVDDAASAEYAGTADDGAEVEGATTAGATTAGALNVAGSDPAHGGRMTPPDSTATDAAAAGTAASGTAAAGTAGPSATRYLVALMAGALVVAALTTPALAATEAGRYAQPHGNHDADFVPAPRKSEQLADVLELDHGHD